MTALFQPRRASAAPGGIPDAGRIPPLAWMIYAAAGLVAALLQWGIMPAFYEQLGIGQRASAAVMAAADFSCSDLAQTELQRLSRADTIPPVFQIDSRPLEETRRQWSRLLDRIEEIRGRPAALQEEDPALIEALAAVAPGLSQAQALRLVPHDAAPGFTARKLSALFARVWNEGITSPDDRLSAVAGRIQLEREGAVTRIVETGSLPTPEKALKQFLKIIGEDPQLRGVSIDAIRTLGAARLAPNLVYQAALTEERRARAAAEMKPVLRTVRSGSLIIRRGETASPQTIEMLRAHQAALLQSFVPRDRRVDFAGRALLLFAGLTAVLLALRIFRPDQLASPRTAVFFVALTAIELGAARLALLAATGEYGWSPSFARFLFPLAFVPIAAALLVDPLFAILAGTWAGLSASLLADVPMDVVWISLLSSTVAVTATRKVRTRARLLRAGFWSGTAGIVYVIASGILHAQNPSIVLAQAVGAGASGMLSALGVLLLLPALEWMFGFSSDIRLLEFTDPAHPLLQRLALEAPGTYHHSLMVAHLSQAAAHAIGANELLVRVGAMFHDIGKIAKPGYFIENQPGGLNPHDELSPSMSRMILSSHIREGQALARQHRIPRSIVEAIEQHHGTSRMDFFYNRFVQKSPEKTETEPRDGDFRYDGPRPRSREMSILALADTVEAAVRTQDKPSPARLQALVKDLTLRKLQDGQFGESSLTFRELERVTDAFVFTLVNMAHGRIAYPEHEHRSDTTTGRPAPEDAGHDSVGPVADGAGPAPKSAP